MDSGDKASNKCMSVAYKYSCFQILSIPTEETTADPDDETETFAKPAQKPAQRAQKAPEITAEALTAAGVKDAQGMIDWLEKQMGMPVAMFDDDERARAWDFIRKRVASHAQATV